MRGELAIVFLGVTIVFMMATLPEFDGINVIFRISSSGNGSTIEGSVL